MLFLQLLFFSDGSSLFRFKIFNLLLDFIRAWDFGNTEILGLPVMAIYKDGEKVEEVVKDDATQESIEAMIKKYI